MSVSLAILILYIIALFGISWFAKKRSEGNAENYALAGRRLSAPLIAVTIIGLAVGGASTIGVSEHAFRVGLSAGWYTIAWAIGAIVMGIFMAKKYREQNITTISELIERHHGTNAVILGVFCQIVIQLVIISLQYIAGGSILHAIMPEVFDFKTGMLVSAITFISITFFSIRLYSSVIAPGKQTLTQAGSRPSLILSIHPSHFSIFPSLSKWITSFGQTFSQA